MNQDIPDFGSEACSASSNLREPVQWFYRPLGGGRVSACWRAWKLALSSRWTERSAHVNDVTLAVDAQFLLHATHTAYEHGVPLLAKLLAMRVQRLFHAQFAVIVFAATHAGMCTRYALRAFTRDDHVSTPTRSREKIIRSRRSCLNRHPTRALRRDTQVPPVS